MTSTLRPTSSAASPRRRSARPPASRYSMLVLFSFDPSEVAQALSKCIYLTGDGGVGDTCYKAYSRDFCRLLCASDQRPRSRRSTNKRNELSPPHSMASCFHQFSFSSATSICRVASATSSRFWVSAASRIISAARSHTGRACRKGLRSRIRIAASISVTRCEPGPRVRVIGWASGRERSGADGRGNLFSPGLFNVLDCDDPPKSPKQKDRSGYNHLSNNTETDCHDPLLPYRSVVPRCRDGDKAEVPKIAASV